MLNIRLTGDVRPVLQGVQLLQSHLRITISDGGYPLTVHQRKGPIEVRNRDGIGEIYYQEKIHFFRGLGLWLENFQNQKEFEIIEYPQFRTSGVMLDASRNAVLQVEEIQSLMRNMAVMGLNLFMLYTEDTYEIPDYPYFGYMRGRYTGKELRTCDEYAGMLGIEMIPCIQTLAHLKMVLKWGFTRDIRDTDDILLAGEAKTYEFIEKMIVSASRPFRSKRIHIGMDEAHQLGLGRYLELHGYRNRFDIMNEHLKRVVSICERHGLKPMMWSDMYFRLGSPNGEYYDENVIIPEKAVETIPENIQLVYWDYYHTDEAFYRSYIQKHKELGRETLFAGGAWTWNGISPNYGRAFVATEAALAACKKEKIGEVFTTLWGDNGAETPVLTALPVLQLFAEHTYRQTVSKEHLRSRFRFCTGYHWDDFLTLNEFDETPGVQENNLNSSNGSKILLWQDVLLGLFDEDIRGLDMDRHYTDLIPKLKKAKEQNAGAERLFGFYEKLAQVLRLKSEMGIRLKDAYDRRNRQRMGKLLEQIRQIREDVEELHSQHRTLWFSLYKPFGWEILELRYGGLEARLKTAEWRIRQWLDGEIEQLEELEEKRLPFDHPDGPLVGSLGNYFYHRIVSAGNQTI
jgi:Glycosyl hydrolase family 20, catalytic domain.